MRHEVIPITLVSLFVVSCYNYKTQIMNLFFANDALSASDERFIVKRLSGLLDYTYKHGKLPVGDDLIDV